MIYVRDLLKLDTFKDFELVSGENGLDRGVSWPNVAQTVSIREWLVGGDVILMSGVGLKITDEFLTDIVIQAAIWMSRHGLTELFRQVTRCGRI